MPKDGALVAKKSATRTQLSKALQHFSTKGDSIPRYFFHLRHPYEALDEVGSELPDEQATHKEAVAAAREVVANAIRAGRNFTPEQIVIADATGREVATVNITDVLPASVRH